MTDHRYLAVILEVKVDYINGEQSLGPIGLIKDENPHAVANYVMFNDLGPVSTATHKIVLFHSLPHPCSMIILKLLETKELHTIA